MRLTQQHFMNARIDVESLKYTQPRTSVSIIQNPILKLKLEFGDTRVMSSKMQNWIDW